MGGSLGRRACLARRGPPTLPYPKNREIVVSGGGGLKIISFSGLEDLRPFFRLR